MAIVNKSHKTILFLVCELSVKVFASIYFAILLILTFYGMFFTLSFDGEGRGEGLIISTLFSLVKTTEIVIFWIFLFAW